MAKAKFYLPFAYFFATRVTSVSARISWGVIYVLALSVSLVCLTSDLPWRAWLDLCLGMTVIYLIYELGYIENDSKTILAEDNPTLRLSDSMAAYARDAWASIVFVRLAIAGVLLAVVHQAPGFLWFGFSLCLLAPLFALYNRVRGKMNALLHPGLVTIRYCAPLLLVSPAMGTLVYSFLLFPLINALERAAEPRYGISWLQGLWLANQVSGRWSYYGGLLIVAAIYLFVTNQHFVVLLPILLMFGYRLATAFIRPEKAL